MLGTRTTAAVRTSLAHIDANLDAVSEDLATVYVDTRECLVEVKAAAQSVNRASMLLGIVAVIGLAFGMLATVAWFQDR